MGSAPLTCPPGRTSSSGWPPPAPAVPATPHLVRTVIALLLATVLIRVATCCRSAGPPTSEPETTSRSSSRLFCPPKTQAS